MGAPQITSRVVDVRALGDALPTAQRSFRRRVRAPSKPRPEILPACFEEVWRRRESTNAAHIRERATLEAIVSTIPKEATDLTGQSGAAVYLAALVLSLQRFLENIVPTKAAEKVQTDKKLSKKERKKLRRQQLKKEDAVKEMAAAEALGTKAASGDVAMEDDEHENGKSNDNVEFIANLVYLIALAARGSSQAVLQTKYEVILQVIMDAFDHVSGNEYVARHCSSALAAVLVVLDSSSWSKPVVQRAYLYMLRLTCDPDSRARRKGRDELDALLRSPRGDMIKARTSASGSAHFVSEIRMQVEALESALSTGTKMEESAIRLAVIYVLTSVEQFAKFFAPQDAAKICKELVLLGAEGFPEVSAFAFEAASTIFGNGLDDPQQRGRLPQMDLGKLLQALLQHSLADNCNEEVRIGYNSCVASGAVAYASYFKHAAPPKEFVLGPVNKLCESMQPGIPSKVTNSVSKYLWTLVQEEPFQTNPEILSKLQELSMSAYRRLPHVLNTLQCYLEIELSAGSNRMASGVEALVKEWKVVHDDSLKEEDLKAREAARNVLAAVIRGGGAKIVLDLITVRYDKQNLVTNAWVLPILHNKLGSAPLSIFGSKFIPLADQLYNAMEEAKRQKRDVESKNLGMYFSQIWNLLPGFCRNPSDLGVTGVFSMAFKAINTCLTSERHAALKPIGVTALRQLAISMQGLDDEDPTTAVKKDSFGSRLKKLFPTIIDLADKLSSASRDPILQAVTTACMATGDRAIVSSLLKKTIRRLLELQLVMSKNDKAKDDDMVDVVQNTLLKQNSAADIAIAITESGLLETGADELRYLEKAMSPLILNPREPALQKKGYKATALLIEKGSLSKTFEEVKAFARNMADCSGSVALAAKPMRLRLIKALVNQHMELQDAKEKTEYLKLQSDLFLSEVILGTRESSENTRTTSFETLMAMARGWNLSSTGNDTEGIQQFFLSVAAGLGGKTVPMLSATLTSLGRLMFEFRGEASSDVKLGNLVDSMFASRVTEGKMVDEGSEKSGGQGIAVEPGPIAILLRHDASEVQKSALGVMKIATRVLCDPVTRLTEVLPGILPGLVHAAARSKKREVRIQVRIILERLMKKCGLEVLEMNFPEEHMKLLNAVRKSHSREVTKKQKEKEKRKAMGGTGQGKDMNSSDDDDGEVVEDDSDSDVERDLLDGDEMLASDKKKEAKRSAGGSVREKQGEVVDLLDVKNASMLGGDKGGRTASQKLRQERKRIGRSDDVVKYSDDGRPIFVESDDDSGEAEKGSMVDSESDSEAEVGTSRKQGPSGVGKKRQRGGEDGGRHEKKMKGSFGEEYKSRKASGDVKRAGRPDPYAYVPLGASMFNKSTLQRVVGTKESRRRIRALGVPGKR